jgi:dolichol-phosphate mannosyltransferase
MSAPGAVAPERVLVILFAFNEGGKLERALGRFPADRPYRVMVMDDGSTDGTPEMVARHPGVLHLRNERNMGIGFAMRRAFAWAVEQGYEAVIPFAGNDKDRPHDIPLLLEALAQGCDFVQGSRYLAGGRHGNMPLYRQLATRWVHPLLFSLVSGRRITDSTNGFRAVRAGILKDPRLDLSQAWLDQYELEPYLFFKAIRLGYRVAEVPVTKIYPERKAGSYTKMKPIRGWWSILRPLVFLGLRIKR